MKKFNIILAVDNENWIGKCWDLAWRIPDDMKYFKNITTTTKDSNKQNAVVMGRITWESIPEKFRPLPNRYNCILSRNYQDNVKNSQGAIEFSSLDTCLGHLETNDKIESIFIIWWAELYNISLKHPNLDKAYITRIYNKYHCDAFFNGLPLDFDLESRSEMKEHDGVEFEYSVYTKKQWFMKKIKNIFKK